MVVVVVVEVAPAVAVVVVMAAVVIVIIIIHKILVFVTFFLRCLCCGVKHPKKLCHKTSSGKKKNIP